jgi:hypothetical protein
MRGWIVILVAGVGVFSLAEVEIPPLPSAAEIALAPSYGAEDRIVATHYFYWYHWPSEHFFDDVEHTDDAQRQHFPRQHEVSYLSEAWHRGQMEGMLEAGVDVALCVYWGAPNQYEKPSIRFSVAGLPPLVRALDRLSTEGRAPRIGLFYDTSTLLGRDAYCEPGRGNVDLRTPEGRDIFYRTVRDFFRLVPPRHWACVDGRPLVQLYNAAFAAGHDQRVIDKTYERFAADFAGRKPFIIAGPSWHVRADARTGWGAALAGPIVGDFAVQVGAGYDDSPVPGRTTPTRDRLGGGFYRASWLLALQARPRLVIIETWNELHEGTGICETVEDGTYYVEMTRHFATLLRRGAQPDGEDWAEAVRDLLATRSSNRDGREWASRIWLRAHVDAGGQLCEEGLRVIPGVADGLWELKEVGGHRCIATRPGMGKDRMLYLALADPYYFDHRGTLTVQFTYLDAGRAPIRVQYDSTDETGTIADRYKMHGPGVERQDSGQWRTATLHLPGARCANRQNGGADLRLLSIADELCVRDVRITKLPVEDHP